jgi:hypothetical protein
MSVLVPEFKMFQQVLRRVECFQFNRTCDIDYCYSLSMNERDAKQFVLNLIQLNELTYIRRYEEETPKTMLHEMFETQSNTKRVETLQLLKFLQCIDYNIDLQTIKTGKRGTESHEIDIRLVSSHETLQRAIEELKSTIISELTNYKELNYSEAV